MQLPGFMKRKTWVLVTGITVLVLVATGVIFLKVAKSDPKVATYKITRGEFIIDISQPGELDATKAVSVTVPSRRYGNTRIMNMVADGTMVKEGDFLIQFDTSDAAKEVEDRKNELEQAKADLASSKASIESNMKQLDNALKSQQYDFESNKLTYELAKFEADIKRREMELTFKKSELSLEQAKQKIESQKIIDKATLSRAELRVRQAELRYSDAKKGLEELTMRSPKSGLVVLREIWGPSGRQKVKIGDTPWSGQELISIPDLAEMKVKSKVNEVDISRIKKGQPVVITLDALHGPIFTGKVSSVATLARREGDSEVKVFDVEVTIDGTHAELKPGMTAQVKIVTGKIQKVVSVPLEAVFDKGDTTIVYVKKHGWDRRPVKLGSKNSDYVIIEKGVEPGDEVALRDPTAKLEELGKEGPASGEKNGSGGAKPAASGGGPRGGGERH